MKENQPHRPHPQGGGLSLQDVLLSLFKHKWKILLLTLLGLGASVAVHFNRPAMYESRAKLLVKYVLERPGIDPYESKKDAGGRSGQEIINAEIELLTSLDLAESVASTLGARHFLGEAMAEKTGGVAPSLAASAILGNLNARAAGDSNVIHVSYRHSDPRYAREVLSQLVERYLTEHLRVHRSGDAFETVAKEREEVRLALRRTDAELNALKQENMIVSSLEDTSAALQNQITATLGVLRPAEADLIQQEARVRQIEKVLGVSEEGGEVRPKDPDGSTPPIQLGAHVLEEYRSLSGRITALRSRELELLDKFTEDSGSVRRVKAQIGQLEAQRKALLEKHPALVTRELLSSKTPLTSGPDLEEERAALFSMAAKVEVLKAQYEELQNRYKKLLADRPQLERLERELAEHDEKYRLLTTSHDKALVDQTLNPANMPNISPLQKPSLPSKIYDERLTKLMYGLAVAGLAVGIGLALLLEIVLNDRIRQPLEIETRLRMPLMLSIPYAGRKQRHGTLVDRKDSGYLEAKEELNGKEDVNVTTIVPTLELADSEGTRSFLRPYCEAIRDRLVYYFELNNMTHKPKLVAFAGFTEGAGTTTLATSVAEAFAEGDDSKVLLVDMNPTGKPANGTSRGSSALGKLQVGENPLARNLYVATAPQKDHGSGSGTLAPRSFYELMPKFRASEFDYIIFDMPPVDQTSPTLSIAGFMDQVVLVLDAENTNRDRLKRAHAQLRGGKADVTCVVNKTRRHAPRWVQSEV